MNNTTTNLLEQVNLVKNKYDDLAEYTGENFNVFNILNLYSHELSHSAFIGNLLNVKGKHGQKDIFLKLFIEEIKEVLNLDYFNTLESYVITEKYIANYESGEKTQGYIDILITNNRSNIIIENKIWAGDQPYQLIKYNNAYKNTSIIYLTLYERQPSDNSKGNLKEGEDFICITYKEHIKNWLEKCIKEMANKPIIRETLNQYLHLIKQLTNQTSNKNMAQEITDLIIKNIEASKLIRDNYDSAIFQASLLQIEKLKNIIESKGLKCNIERASRGGDGLFVEIKSFEIDEEFFDLGINIELANDYFFFCAIKKGENRGDKMNDSKFTFITEYLHNKISNLSQPNVWTIGKANDFIIGIDINNYYLPSTDNTPPFEKLAERILEFKKLLTQ